MFKIILFFLLNFIINIENDDDLSFLTFYTLYVNKFYKIKIFFW